MKNFILTVSLIVPLFITLHCGGALPTGTEESDDQTSDEEDEEEIVTVSRLVTGSLVSYEYNTMALSRMSKKSTCMADQIIGVDVEGNSTLGEVTSDCTFSLELTVGVSYVISFTKESQFIATLTFNNLNTPALPIMEGKTPFDLGEITVNGVEATCKEEEKVICNMDGDKDGISICEDDDEKGDTKNNAKGDPQNKKNNEGKEPNPFNLECNGDHKVQLCHLPPGNTDKAHTICVDIHAAQYYNHLKHGDTFGECEDDEKVTKTDKENEDDDVEEEKKKEVEEENEENEVEEKNDDSCEQAVYARFDFHEIKNWKNGNLQPVVYVGDELEPYEDGENFMLVDEEGNRIIDETFVQDVPGLAFKRGDGFIQFSFWGHHLMGQGKEAVTGDLVFDGATIKKAVNVKEAPFERQGNGIAIFGQAGEDEYEIVDDFTLELTSTVTVHRDDLKIYYEVEKCEE